MLPAGAWITMDEERRSFVVNKLDRLQHRMQALWDQIQTREREGVGGLVVARILWERYKDLEEKEEKPLLKVIRSLKSL